MKPKIVAIAAALALVASACDRLPFVGEGGDERTVLVDFSHDEFSSALLFNYPRQLAVTPGTKLVFRQTWTGEPHTITGGSIVSEALDTASTWMALIEGMVSAGVRIPGPGEGSGESPDIPFADVIETIEASDSEEGRAFLTAYEALVEDGSDLPPLDDLGEISVPEVDEITNKELGMAFGALLFAFGEEDEASLTQNVSRACYLREGRPPEDENDHCTAAQQEKPVFDGSHSFFNSGIIPYEGPAGNTFDVQLSDDIDPGKYWFYCAVHGPFQSTEVEVKPSGTEVPSQADVSRQAREEIDDVAEPLRDLYRQAVRRNRVEISTLTGPQRIRGPFGGLWDTSITDQAVINEFIPKQLEVRAGEPITWRLMGAAHTVSFDVPRYIPIVQFLNDGTVRLNPKIEPPAGGSTPIPEGVSAPVAGQERPRAVEVDGGTYDGTGFWSSGLMGGEPYAEYTMRISRPGTYDFACLIHPPMVGTIEVT